MFLSLSVLFSGFLVLSIEKNWWGGYLSWSELPKNEAQSYSDMMLSLYHFKNKWTKAGATYKHELYTIGNFMRLTIVSDSLTFFMVISLLDLMQLYI